MNWNTSRKYTQNEYGFYCDRCEKRYDLIYMREEWTGYVVCEWCYDEKHPLLDEGSYISPEQPMLDIVRPGSALPINACSIAGIQGVVGYAIAGCAVVGKNDTTLLGAGLYTWS